MIERITQLRNKASERARYYGNISFEILEAEFTEFAKILDEILPIAKENEELKAQVQLLKQEAQARIDEARAARAGEECMD